MIWKPTCKNIGAEDGKGLSYIPYISDKGKFATIIIAIPVYMLFRAFHATYRIRKGPTVEKNHFLASKK